MIIRPPEILVRLCNCICHFVLGSQWFTESLNIYLTCQGGTHLISRTSWIEKPANHFDFSTKRWMIYDKLWRQRRLFWSSWSVRWKKKVDIQWDGCHPC